MNGKKKKTQNEKITKLIKLNAYEGFLVDFDHIVRSIMKEEMNILAFRSSIKALINKIIREVTDHEYYFFKMLASLDSPHKFVSHSVNTAIYAHIISLNLDLENQAAYKVFQAALLHDIGKLNFIERIRDIYIDPDEDPEQVAVYHPAWGERLLLNHLKADPDVARLVLNHHEQNDGSGVPRGIKGNSLSLYDHIIITANLIDNAAQRLNYPGITVLSKNIETIFEKHGQKFIPAVMDVLKNVLSMKEEERKYRRFKLNIKGRIENETVKINTICDIVNVSSGGIEVATPFILNPGMDYKINTRLSSDLYLKDELCEIKWDALSEGKYIYGMKFDNPNPDISSKLMNIN